jgi:hypothetical protein
VKREVGLETVASLLVAAVLAVAMGFALTLTSLPMAFGIGLLLVVLIVALASNELALYLLVLSMLLGPQVVTGDLGGGATLGRGMTLRLDDFLLVIVGVAWLGKTALHKEVGLVFRTPLNHPIAAYSAAAVVATGIGVMAGRVGALGGAFFVLKYIQYFVIFFMVVNNLRERRQFERFVWVLLLTAAAVSLVGILQIPSGRRVSAPFEGKEGEPNTFGGYLVLMLALVLGLYLTSRSVRAKLGLALLAGWISLPLLFTLSRAAYLAVIPLVLALFVYSERRWFLAGGLAVMLALGPFLAPQAVLDRVTFTFTQPPESGQRQIGGVRVDTSTSARLESWEQAVFHDWLDHPLFGYGVTGYRFLDAQYARVLAETGLVGFLSFLWLQVGLFREARRVLRGTADPLYRGVALGFLCGFIALVIHSIGANTFIIVRIMEPFWFLAGMVLMIPQLEATGAAGAPASAAEASRRRPGRLLPARV